MKKILLIASALVVTLSFASCTKDYTCSCDDGNGNKEDIVIPNTTKALAKTSCSASSTAYSGGCSLK